MARMNVDYDLLTWEGDILRLKFWAQAFDVLKARKAVHLQTEGRLSGCWVMPIQEDLDEKDDDPPTDEGGEEREKVIVRSNGVVTYVGKDIAYQFWKLGLLGRDFHYRVFTPRPHGPLWATTSGEGAGDHPLFGGAAYVYNVIDVRPVVPAEAAEAGADQRRPSRGRRNGSHHFSYEMVALSHATARELGFAPAPDSEDAKRPFVEVSGRKGLGVKADDLLDIVIRKAADEVSKRNAALSPADVQETASAIGIAAVRYFLVKFSRGKVIAFDLEEAVSFEGETGPYIQYAVVRANKIFKKLEERDGTSVDVLTRTMRDVPPGELEGSNGGDELWSLVLEASRLDEVVEQVIRTLEFSVLAKYAFSLAQAFNGYYNLHPNRSSILNEERDDVRRWRAAGVLYVRDQLTRALDLMGIDVPGRM
jgi:arginyl-tRNA synthetase